MTPKLIFSLIALILAFTFTFFAPGLQYIDQIVVVVGTVAGFLGVTNWRATYQNAVDLFKSKTIWGAVIVVIPMLIIVIVPIFFQLPHEVNEVLMWIVTGGGGLTLYGIFDATKK